ncbi:MAG: hypothetical protein Q9217_005745 [Psora testacea]
MTDPNQAVNSHSSPSNPPDADINMDSNADLDVDLDMALDGAADPINAEDIDPTILETREPTKKDISLREFVSKMDDYAPIQQMHINTRECDLAIRAPALPRQLPWLLPVGP